MLRGALCFHVVVIPLVELITGRGDGWRRPLEVRMRVTVRDEGDARWLMVVLNCGAN